MVSAVEALTVCAFKEETLTKSRVRHRLSAAAAAGSAVYTSVDSKVNEED